MILCACHGSKGRGEADESSHGGGMGGSGAGGRPGGGVASVAYRADRIESQVGRVGGADKQLAVGHGS